MDVSRRGFLIGAAGAAVVVGAGASAGPASAVGRGVPRPIASLVTRWDIDPYARGAYSALPPGVSPGVRRTLADAVLGGRVVLAGEYVSSSRPSTTSGAYDSGVHAARRVLERVHARRVIVIGAGMAGAAAARTLSAQGIDVTVLEARDRIGGRIHSDKSWGAPVELGAAWIHGLTGNPVTPLAKADGLRLVRTDYEDAITRDSVTGAASSRAETAQAQMVRLVSQLEKAWPRASMSTDEWLRAHNWKPDRFASWAAEVEITQEYGLAPAALGVRAAEEGVTLRGGDAFVAGGYARIPRTLLQGVDVRLSTPVSSVGARGGYVRVECRDGRALRADAVIVAVPVSVLRAGAIAIEPMTASVRGAIKALRTGDLEKVVLRYREQWWPDRQLIGIVGGGVVGAPAGSLAALRWTEFYSMTSVLGFPALVAFSGGAASRARPRSDAACVAEAVAMLDAAFPRG